MTHVLTCRALVLRTFDYGETSQIVHLLTRELGRVHGIAKGARRLKGSFHGGMDLLSLGEISLYPRRGTRELWTLSAFEGITHFPGLRASLDRYHAAEHCAALVLAFAREEQPLPELFDLTESCLRLLECATDDEADALRLGFEAMLLQQSGFAPDLSRCVGCGRPARNIRVTRLSVQQGGLLCRACAHLDPRAWSLTGRAVATLHHLGQGPLTLCRDLPDDRPLRREVRKVLGSWTSSVLDRPIGGC